MNLLSFPICIRFAVPKLFALSLALFFTASAMAQDDSQGERHEQQQKMLESQFFMNQLMMLGHDKALRKELEVVEEQVKDLKKLAKDYHKELTSFYTNQNSIQKMPAGELQRKIIELSQGFMDKASGVLLPHQITRLQQIAKQQRIKLTNQYSDEFGVASSLSKELGLTEQEKEQLEEATEKARQEYYETVATAKKKAKEKIMAALTTQQQDQMNEILGEDWDQDKVRREARLRVRKNQKKFLKFSEHDTGGLAPCRYGRALSTCGSPIAWPSNS